MATTLNTDIAVNLDITARRNDTFKMILQVKDSAGAAIDMNENGSGSGNAYQGKMSIVSSGGEEILTIFSQHWEDALKDTTNHPADVAPEANSTGYYTGASPFAISFTDGGDVNINVPYNYMDFQSGTYNYDLQIRKSPDGGDLEYTTWLYGTFTLRPDITQL